MLNRRQFNHVMPLALAATAGLAGCTSGTGESAYRTAVQQTWRVGPLQGFQGAALGSELVRYATLAPSSHNTQCWKFGIKPHAITILPDLARRCPAVDPDDHHLFVSPRCTAENLVQALRPSFADFLGVDGRRPDLVVRIGRGRTLPPSLRAVLV